MKLSDLARSCAGDERAASTLAQVRPTRTSQATRRRPCGNGARSTSRLRTRRPAASAAPPLTAHALISAAMQTGAGGGAVDAGVYAAPGWLPSGRRAFYRSSQAGDTSQWPKKGPNGLKWPQMGPNVVKNDFQGICLIFPYALMHAGHLYKFSSCDTKNLKSSLGATEKLGNWLQMQPWSLQF